MGVRFLKYELETGLRSVNQTMHFALFIVKMLFDPAGLEVRAQYGPNDFAT